MFFDESTFKIKNMDFFYAILIVDWRFNMYKVFNSNVLSKNARFIRGLLAGLGCSLILAVLYGAISKILFIEFSAAFIGIGYLIGEAIKKFGRGVKIEFSIMGALLTLLCIVVADLIAIFGFENVINLGLLPQILVRYMRMMLSSNVNSILSVAFRAVGIYVGYQNSRII